MFQALKAFVAPLADLTESSFAEEGFFYQIGVIPVRVDIVMSVAGVEFQDAWDKRVEVDLDGVNAHFISKEDLIVSKLAAARPQDILDARFLSYRNPNLKENESKDYSFTRRRNRR